MNVRERKSVNEHAMKTTMREDRKNKLNIFFQSVLFLFFTKVQFAYHFILKLPDRKLMNKRHSQCIGREGKMAIKFYAKINLE